MLSSVDTALWHINIWFGPVCFCRSNAPQTMGFCHCDWRRRKMFCKRNFTMRNKTKRNVLGEKTLKPFVIQSFIFLRRRIFRLIFKNLKNIYREIVLFYLTGNLFLRKFGFFLAVKKAEWINVWKEIGVSDKKYITLFMSRVKIYTCTVMEIY